MQSPGCHLTPIPKGELGQLSKIKGEAVEVWGADRQGATIMVLVELSDLIGATHSLQAPPDETRYPYEPGTIAGIRAIAGRAFSSGRRS